MSITFVAMTGKPDMYQSVDLHSRRRYKAEHFLEYVLSGKIVVQHRMVGVRAVVVRNKVRVHLHNLR